MQLVDLRQRRPTTAANTLTRDDFVSLWGEPVIRVESQYGVYLRSEWSLRYEGGGWRVVTEGVGVARQHDVRWGRSLCDGNASIADFFVCFIFFFDFLSALPFRQF